MLDTNGDTNIFEVLEDLERERLPCIVVDQVSLLESIRIAFVFKDAGSFEYVYPVIGLVLGGINTGTCLTLVVINENVA